MKITRRQLRQFINRSLIVEVGLHDQDLGSGEWDESTKDSKNSMENFVDVIQEIDPEKFKSDINKAEADLLSSGVAMAATDLIMWADTKPDVWDHIAAGIPDGAEINDLSELRSHIDDETFDTLREESSDVLAKAIIRSVAGSADLPIPTGGDYIMRLLTKGLKRVIFGFGDNAILIAASAAIESRIAGRVVLRIAIVGTMVEAIGNAISDGFSEIVADPVMEMLGEHNPAWDPQSYVTDEQMKEAPWYWRAADLTTSTVAVIIGCLIGAAVLFAMPKYRIAAAAAKAAAATGGTAIGIRTLAAGLGPVGWGLLIGGTAMSALTAYGRSQLEEEKIRVTVEAVNWSFFRVLIESGILWGPLNDLKFDPVLEPFLRKLTSVQKMTPGEIDEMWELLSRPYSVDDEGNRRPDSGIDREVFEREMNPEDIASNDYIKLETVKIMVSDISSKLGYLVIESRWQKLAGII